MSRELVLLWLMFSLDEPYALESRELLMWMENDPWNIFSCQYVDLARVKMVFCVF